MNKATKARKEALVVTTMMVRDGVVYQHNPATVGHVKHTAECWTVILSDTVDNIDPNDQSIRHTAHRGQRGTDMSKKQVMNAHTPSNTCDLCAARKGGLYKVYEDARHFYLFCTECIKREMLAAMKREGLR